MTAWFENLRKLFLIYMAVALASGIALFIIFGTATKIGWLP